MQSSAAMAEEASTRVARAAAPEPPAARRSQDWVSSIRAQALLVVLAWAFIGLLHFDNEGLWYQGDAPRHAMNGIFWGDVLSTIPGDPRAFALEYYARYPAINPTSYPPVFYLLEAAAFAIAGPSGFVAKGLVQLFALLACFCALAWLRRWVSPEAGWGAVLLALQPGFLRWSNVVMLNLPAVALALVATYYARRWTDAAIPRHIYLAAIASLLAVLTYFPAALTVPAIVAMMLVERRGRLLRSGRMWVMGAAAVVTLAVLVLILSDLAPLHYAQAKLSDLGRLLSASNWTFYPRKLPNLLHASILGLFMISPLVALLDRRSRHELALLWSWCLVTYLGLSMIFARDERYGLLLVPAVVLIATMVVIAATRAGAAAMHWSEERTFVAAAGAMILLHVASAPSIRIPSADGFREVAEFLEQNAPDARILYEGLYDGVFTFYVRAGDPDFRRVVVRGNKLLYASAIFRDWRLTQYVSGPGDVVERLRTECGCEWIAIERGEGPDQVEATTYLREALRGPEFEHVATFPIRSTDASAVDLYRFRLPFETPETIELPFPILGTGELRRARPIER